MAKNGAVILTTPTDVRAKSFLHALSEIQQLRAIESHADIPDGIVPFIPVTTFAEIAIRTAFLSTIYTFLVSPFSIAVTTKILPIFNTTNPNFIDKIFSYALAVAPVLAISFLIIFILLEGAYTGKTVRKIVQTFIVPFVATKIFVSFFMSMIVMLTYNYVTAQKIIKFMGTFLNDKFIQSKPSIYATFYNFTLWILEFREIIPKSVKFSVSIHVVTAVLIVLAYLYLQVKAKKIEIFRREWE